MSFLHRCLLNKNTLITIGDIKHFKVWITTNKHRNNKYFVKSQSISDVIKSNRDSLLLIDGSYDPYLLDRLVSKLNTEILCDNDCMYKHMLIDLCEKYNKRIVIKHKLDNYCILSGQRSGSTMIIDTLQKQNTNYLTLSEIFQSDYIL